MIQRRTLRIQTALCRAVAHGIAHIVIGVATRGFQGNRLPIHAEDMFLLQGPVTVQSEDVFLETSGLQKGGVASSVVIAHFHLVSPLVELPVNDRRKSFERRQRLAVGIDECRRQQFAPRIAGIGFPGKSLVGRNGVSYLVQEQLLGSARRRVCLFDDGRAIVRRRIVCGRVPEAFSRKKRLIQIGKPDLSDVAIRVILNVETGDDRSAVGRDHRTVPHVARGFSLRGGVVKRVNHAAARVQRHFMHSLAFVVIAELQLAELPIHAAGGKEERAVELRIHVGLPIAVDGFDGRHLSKKSIARDFERLRAVRNVALG